MLVDVYGERMMAMARKQGAKQSLEMTGDGLRFGMCFADDWEGELSAFIVTQGEGSEGGGGPARWGTRPWSTGLVDGRGLGGDLEPGGGSLASGADRNVV